MLVSYNWLKEYLGEDASDAQTCADVLGAHAFEIEEVTEKGTDTVIEVDILPNRSSDCLSHRGIARELASITGKKLEKDPLAEPMPMPMTDLIEVDIEDVEACPRFTASLITGVEIKESPDWLKDRLEAIGQRPINNIVDATNYVMYAVGQPLHAYDADLFPQVDGKWQFVVRAAREGENISLLPEGTSTEDRVVELKGGETLVVDGSNDTPIGLAGVKGGRFAGVHAGTTQVIIEAANWHPTRTRKTARPLGIITDAGKRFENEVARELAMYAQTEIVDLILKIAGGICSGTVDTYLERKDNQPVSVSTAKANALLGLSLEADVMEDILKRVGCEVGYADGAITATGPWERTDLNIEEDFIEEIGRIYGYEKVTSVVPEIVQLTELNARHFYSEKVRDALASLGFSEVITSSFRKKDQIKLQNALASDKAFMRSSLVKNISETLDKNASFIDLLGTDDTRAFEIGTVFAKGESGIAEHVSLCFGVRLKTSGYSGKEDKVVTEVCEVLKSALGTDIEWSIEKGVVECHFTNVFESLPSPAAYEPVVVAAEIVYQPFSVYPSMSRDIAMWVAEGTDPSVVAAALRAAAGPLLARLTHVDTFLKDGRLSLAYRLVFQSHEKTLDGSEVDGIMDTVYGAASTAGGEVR